AGPGLKEEQIPSDAEGTYPGRWQPYQHGSYITVADPAGALLSPKLSACAWILPTTPRKGAQGIIARYRASSGFALVVDEQGMLALWIGGEGRTQRFSSGGLLRVEWTFVAASYDADKGIALLYQQPLRPWPDDPSVASVRHQAEPLVPADAGTPLLIGACGAADPSVGEAEAHFNGKIDRPCLIRSALTAEQLALLAAGGDYSGDGLVRSWDLGADPSSDSIPDMSGNGHDGFAINLPTRAVTGHNWSGRETDYKLLPEEYTAAHFHDDDLDDARWATDFTLTVADDLRSGI